MARNRLITHIDDSAIAAVAEYATEHTSGDFDAALEEVIGKGTATASKPKPAAAKKPAAKSRK